MEEYQHFLRPNNIKPELQYNLKYSIGGYGNGYVVIPKDHPFVLYYQEWDQSDFILNVHGGVTYFSKAEKCNFVPSNIYLSKEDYIVGFDTYHYTDTIENCSESMVLVETLFLKLQLLEIYNNSMNKLLVDVEAFNKSFNIDYKHSPSIIGMSEYRLRHNLMEEENNEYLDACKDGNIFEIADALGDQLYILCGTILKHGLQDKIIEVFSEIQRSNMSKLGKNGEPLLRADGKILKGPDYSPPDIQKILDSHEV